MATTDNDTKRCCSCRTVKPRAEFGKNKCTQDGLEARCNGCRKAHRVANAEKTAARNKRYRENQGDALRAKKREYRVKNIDRIKARLREYHAANREKQLENMKAYRVSNAEAISAQRREYRESKKDDAVYQLGERLRGRTAKAFSAFRAKGISAVKAAPTEALLGMSFERVLHWIEFLFEPGMTWENYGSHWHVDHVLPVAAFDLSVEEQQRICFRWTNIQPKTAADNIAKRDKILLHEFFNTLVSAHRFIQNRGLGRQEYQALRESVAWLRATI